MPDKQYCVYIATNQRRTVLYTGITNDLPRRMYEHKNKLISGFTARYNVNKLVFYECFSSPTDAIKAEKKIKAGSRRKKIELIEIMNPDWEDLSEK